MDEPVERYLQQAPLRGYWSFDEVRQRVTCLVTGHELPVSSLERIKLHFEGRRFLRLKQNFGIDFTQFEAHHIVPHQDDATKLYCKVTKQTLNRLADEVRKHIAGRKYQNALPAYQPQEEEEDDGDEIDGGAGWCLGFASISCSFLGWINEVGAMEMGDNDERDDDLEGDDEDEAGGEDEDDEESGDEDDRDQADDVDVEEKGGFSKGPLRIVEEIDGTPVFRAVAPTGYKRRKK
jgi:hypothetical protein